MAVAIVAAFSVAHAGPVISVNFTGDDSGAVNMYDITGSAGVVSVSNWNNFSGPGTLYGAGLHYNLLDNSGTATPAYINYTSGNDQSTWGLGATAASISDPNVGLFNNYLNYFGNGGQIYIGNLDAAFTSTGYDVIVYFANAYSSTVNISLNDGTTTTTRFAQLTAGNPSNGYGGSFVESTATTFETATVANYVRFSGLTASGFGIFGGGDVASPEIVGFQIVSVPEPSSIALLVSALGAGMLFIRRRKK